MRVTDGCEPPHGCCKLSPGPLLEQQVLITTEPASSPENAYFFKTRFYVAKPNLELVIYPRVMYDLM